ncbi:hypothetical protein H920_04789 [Fukomys damarensis]|uniref:Uncharacterized protein n=1 Tax=Fukomys damarensis TaxID=885580 RepID=A0A091DU59_FUKDA|nr:hypothetical protein H920_04789 [Fukomys damarensis]
MSSSSPASGLEPRQCLRIEDLHLEGPKPSGGSQKIHAHEMRDLCHQAEGSTSEPGSDAHSKGQSSPNKMKAAAIPSDSEIPSSSSDKNSIIRIRKTIRSKLLLENQQAKIFPSSFLFMAIGNSPQVGPPCPDHTDSVQLGVS